MMPNDWNFSMQRFEILAPGSNVEIKGGLRLGRYGGV